MMTLVVNAKVLSHKGVPVFDDMSNEGLKRFIIERYMKSEFNNCCIQLLQVMYTDKPLHALMHIDAQM